MSRKTTILIVSAIVLFVVFIVAVSVAAAILLSGSGSFGEGDVALIRVEGVITSDRGGAGIFGGSSAGAERIVKLLEEFRKDRSTKSLVIRINSPGGSAAGSQEIYREIMRIRREGKKVTVSMGDVAASGGYYIASAADRIYADPATLTGSIGVIMETTDLHELLGKVGIDLVTIKSGKHKDIGSPSRPMTPEERRILQGLIDDVFDQFVTDVCAGRKLPRDYVRKLADGRIYTGRQALKLKLVDRTGSLQDALKAAALDAGIKGEFSVKEYEKSPGLFDLMFGEVDSRLPVWLQRWSRLSELSRSLLKVDSEMTIE